MRYRSKNISMGPSRGNEYQRFVVLEEKVAQISTSAVRVVLKRSAGVPPAVRRASRPPPLEASPLKDLAGFARLSGRRDAGATVGYCSGSSGAWVTIFRPVVALEVFRLDFGWLKVPAL